VKTLASILKKSHLIRQRGAEIMNEYLDGFLDGYYGELINSPLSGRDSYFDGYVFGSTQRANYVTWNYKGANS